MTHTTLHTAPAALTGLDYLQARQPPSPVAQLAIRVAVVFAKWDHRRRSRIALSKLCNHQLRDIGISAHTALTEAQRPFWRG
jgi:uncharacterized protein YjiS (DUF1127 family)